MITAVIAAAGKGLRAGQESNKIFSKIAGKTVLELSIIPFLNNERIDDLAIALLPEDEEQIKKILLGLAADKPVKLIYGGATRTESIMNVLKNINTDIVLIHDAARPYLSKEMLERCIDCTIKYGSAVPVIPATDTMSKVDKDGRLEYSVERLGLCSVQTPQCFFYEDIKKAYENIKPGEIFTDDAGVYSKYIEKAKTVEGDIRNKKLTFKSDFEDMRYFCGTGYDLHKLVTGRRLILGGVEIPHDKGLLGHSDADVITHAVMDALLSAAGLKDIGNYFPDNDPKYKDADSLLLLKEVSAILERNGYAVHNISAVIMAERPKISPFVDRIRQNISEVINIPLKNMGITCTTLEGIGIVGREEGIAASANCLIYKTR